MLLFVTCQYLEELTRGAPHFHVPKTCVVANKRHKRHKTSTLRLIGDLVAPRPTLEFVVTTVCCLVLLATAST